MFYWNGLKKVSSDVREISEKYCLLLCKIKITVWKWYMSITNNKCGKLLWGHPSVTSAKTKWFFYLPPPSPPLLRNTTIQNEATPPPFSFWIVDIRISIWLLLAPSFLWPPHLFKISSKFFSMHFRSEEMGKFYDYISHDTTSLSRHEQVCLSRLCFKRYFSHHWAT